MRLIWATRGFRWGFRFLADGGLADPLPTYEEAFRELEDDAEGCRRTGDMVALRFNDPEGRRDESGRLIPHEVVVFADDSEQVTSLPSGVALVWPTMREPYEKAWSAPRA